MESHGGSGGSGSCCCSGGIDALCRADGSRAGEHAVEVGDAAAATAAAAAAVLQQSGDIGGSTRCRHCVPLRGRKGRWKRRIWRRKRCDKGLAGTLTNVSELGLERLVGLPLDVRDEVGQARAHGGQDVVTGLGRRSRCIARSMCEVQRAEHARQRDDGRLEHARACGPGGGKRHELVQWRRRLHHYYRSEECTRGREVDGLADWRGHCH